MSGPFAGVSCTIVSFDKLWKAHGGKTSKAVCNKVYSNFSGLRHSNNEAGVSVYCDMDVLEPSKGWDMSGPFARVDLPSIHAD